MTTTWDRDSSTLSRAFRPTNLRCRGRRPRARRRGPAVRQNGRAGSQGDRANLSQTASEVAEAAVPGFADAVIIYAAERLLADGEPASRPAGPGAVVRRLAMRLARHEVSAADSTLGAGEVLVLGPGVPGSAAMATGEPILFDRLDEETAERIARHPGGRQAAAGLTSYLAAPLIARGVVVGCAIFGRAPASPAFNEGDILLARELASRAAVCIDNARLYSQERRTALALQQGLLPAQPQVPDGLEVGHRYLPAGASVIGGDWHDIVPLSGGRAALIVGDAMGHGPEAAAVMVQLRTAAHTLADLELPPSQVLRRLDKMAAGFAAAPFATCIYAVLDPPGGSCEIVQAGHLPPALVAPGGDAAMPELPPGLPLGLGAESFQAATVTLPAGAALALYTDGLVESRAQTLDEGMAALRSALGGALAKAGATLADACDAVTERLRQHREDDITLVLARIPADGA